MLSRRSARWALGLSLSLAFACEPGTCNPPPPPKEREPCVDHSDWGICADDGRTALVCLDRVWTRVGCAAYPCARVAGQPTFAGRYWLACGSAPGGEGAACARDGEVTHDDKDPSAVIVCKGKTWKRWGASDGGAQ